MTAIRILPLTLCALALTLGVSFAGDLQLTRTAKSGVASLIGYERSWGKDCQPTGSTITITKAPEHGTARVEEGTSVIPASTPRFGSTGACAGQSISGNQVTYESEAGFRGRDSMAWHADYGNGSSGDTDVTIVVR